MPVLYALIEGKMSRKNAKGVYVHIKSPCRIVPSPSELSAEGYRLRPVGKVDWDHPEALAAIQNTNKLDFPDFGKDAKTDDDVFTPDADTVSDIRAVTDAAAIQKLISGITDPDVLDKYLLQEIDNKPRVRKYVIKAIDTRKLEITSVEDADKAAAGE